MKKNLVSAVLTIIFFIIYWKLLGFIYNLWVPFNPVTDILALFIILIIVIPLSAISAYKILKKLN